MSTKRSNTVYYVLGSLAILFGLFMYWAASDIPLPKNAKKIGDKIYIDISEGATDETEKKEALFVVPEKFKPKVSEGLFTLNFKFPDVTPYTGNETPVPLDRVRVVVRHHAKREAARSSYFLRYTQPPDGTLKNVPYFVESKDGLEIYKADYGSDKPTIATYFKFVAKDGSDVLAEDGGDWSRNYETNRPLSHHIEVTYLFSKKLVHDAKHFIEDITVVDNAVLKLAQSFQPTNSNKGE